MFARRMTSSTVSQSTLNTPPEVDLQTLDDYTKIIEDVGDALRKKKLLTTEVLIDHLQTVALNTHINLTDESKNLTKDYTSIFKIVRDAITADIANDPRPFDMARFSVHKKTLETALLATGLQEIKPLLSTTGTLRTVVTTPAVTSTNRPSRHRGPAKEGA
jgi:hypothetical protein